MTETRRYALTLTKIPREARDEFRRLSRPETYFEIRKGSEGERVAYSVLMTQEEYERACRAAEDPQSNLIIVEEDQGKPRPHATVPGGQAVEFLSMIGLGVSGLNGRGVNVGVIDSGLSDTVRDTTFAGRILAAWRYEADEHGELYEAPLDGDPTGHGTNMCSLAVPPRAQLAITTYGGEAVIAEALYRMADELLIDVVNMSFGFESPSTVLGDACAHAASKNILLFGSRGNDGNASLEYPASYPDVCAISAYDTRTRAKSSYSSYGDVFAASVGDVVCFQNRDGSITCTDQEGGTSAASALATRLAASLLTKNEYGASRWSPNAVKRYMADTARPAAGGPYHHGNGVLQADGVLNKLRYDSTRQGAEPERGKGWPCPVIAEQLSAKGR